MLEYDEWAVPGELEYAQKRAEKIERKIDEYARRGIREIWEWRSIRIPLTEHYEETFKIPLDGPIDYIHYAYVEISNDELLKYFWDKIDTDKPGLYELPRDDVRNQLPYWIDPIVTEKTIARIMECHSARYRIMRELFDYDESNCDRIKKEYHIGENNYRQIMNSLEKKLESKDKTASFSKLESTIIEGMLQSSAYYPCIPNWYDPWDRSRYIWTWDFPVTMSENDVATAVCEAFESARKKSRRIMPCLEDYINIGNWNVKGCSRIKNYQCLYQGKSGDMQIRFLFDYKDMELVMAYPVLENGPLRLSHWEGYYVGDGMFTW